jgi:hypothetical protein
MTLSNNKIIFVFLVLCAFSGIIIGGKLTVWVMFSLLVLPLLVINAYKFQQGKINTIFLIFICSLFISSIINVLNLKIITFLYSLSVGVLFLFVGKKIQKCDEKLFNKIFTFILVSFFCLIILGLFLHSFLGVSDFMFAKVDVSRNIPRSYGPSTEPSYSALTLSICMLVLFSSKLHSYLFIRLMFFLYFICLLLIGSGLGYLSGLLVLVYFFTNSNVKILRSEKVILFVIAVTCLPFITFDIERLKPLFEVSLDFISHGSLWAAFDAIKYADSSAWFRFGPFVEFFRDISTLNFMELLFGHGAGNSTHYFGMKYIKHIDPDWFDANGTPSMDLPFLPAFIYDYGIVPAIIFCMFLFQKIKRLTGSLIIFLITVMILFNSNFNTNIFWFLMYSILVIKQIQFKRYLFEKN